jgi:hypothetical protein
LFIKANDLSQFLFTHGVNSILHFWSDARKQVKLMGRGCRYLLDVFGRPRRRRRISSFLSGAAVPDVDAGISLFLSVVAVPDVDTGICSM